ncbi:F-box protein At1g11270-like [Aegilops tauschii subsp. strangulata]|uniref:F-box protein At1g11270-like n=1 Tax=Aegilops tauschii subsp. strangulata TaxID=200361 RepID=UPI003CC86DD0
MRIALHPRLRRRGSKKQPTASIVSCLPRDIVASILVRLPGSDLRRLRRVCKEWRDIIVDPAFIQEHLIHGSRAPPTHTIVFFESQQGPRNGRGFLLDEQWRLTAEFTPGVQDRLVGPCNGLLCFLEAGQGSIKIVEPSTGESLALPLPPEASGPRWTFNPGAYCFGYDATTKRYKIVHHNYLEYVALPLRPGEAIVDEELHVHTIGGGEGWRRLHVAFSVCGRAYGDPLYVDGSVYWPTRGHGEHRREEKVVRFDLAKENITSEATVRMRLEIPRPETAKLCRLVDSTTSCVMTYGRNCEWDAWFPKAETEEEPVFPGGVVLSTDWVGGLYLRRIERSLEFGPRELLFEAGKEDPRQGAHEYNDTRRLMILIRAMLRDADDVAEYKMLEAYDMGEGVNQ